MLLRHGRRPRAAGGPTPRDIGWTRRLGCAAIRGAQLTACRGDACPLLELSTAGVTIRLILVDRHRAVVASVAIAVCIGVRLVGVPNDGAIVASVARPVSVRIYLGRVACVGAVVE